MLTTAAYAAVNTGRLSSDADTPAEQGDSCLFVSTADGALTVVPVAYIERQSQPSEGRLTLNLINGKRLSFKDVTGCTGTPPEDMPAFTSFKFNNKFNPQLYCDVEAADPSASLIRLEAGGIGKWLTASFQLPDDDTQVFVGTTPQQSKVTRQSFARPVTYTLGRALWKEVQILQDSTGYTYNEIPYGRHQTVAVDFPSDYPIGTYGIPQIHITTETGEPPLSKTEYIEGMAEFYGAGVFPDMGEKRILIRGRGNSSWSDSGATAKNPYHFKFLEKEKPFGLTAGKHWVLLANRQSGSMTANAIGMYISGLMQTAAANHIVPCDLYINGEYRGSYNLTEKVGLHNNSVDLDDDSRATLLELDTYYDEPHRFHSTELGMPVNIHTPDFDDEASTSALTEDNVRRAYNTLEQKTLDNSVADYMDPLYCANFFLVNSLVNNCELGHPKSTFLYNEDIFNIKESPWVWGPVWDLDWGFGYKENSIYFVDDIEEDFIEHLKNSGQVHGAMGRWVESMFNDPEVKAAYNSLLEYYVNGGGLADVLDFCTAYYAFTASSFAHNKTNDNATSSHDKTDYAAQLPQCLEWLKARAYFLANQAGIKINPLPTPPDGPLPPLPDEGLMGDVNGDGAISIADVVCLLNFIRSLEYDACIRRHADVDANGRIADEDAAAICQIILSLQQDAAARRKTLQRQRHLAPATAQLSLEDFQADPETDVTLQCALNIDEGKYCGLQFDLALPAGLSLKKLNPAPNFRNLELAQTQLPTDEDGTQHFRIIFYTDGAHAFTKGRHAFKLTFTAGERTAAPQVISLSSVLLANAIGEEERAANTHSTFTFTPDPLDGVERLRTTDNGQQTTDSEGGLIYDLTGRPVNTSPLGESEGGSFHGVLIARGRKIIF